MDEGDQPHVSVMIDEVLECFKEMKVKTFFEGTLGAGGHAFSILESHPEIETYIGCDQDEEALNLAQENLSAWKPKLKLVHRNFADAEEILDELGVEAVDGFFLI